jgi:hyaluronoglucosaminidase
VERIGDWGLDHYVHAPKDDRRHRRAWREPYVDIDLAHFRSLVRHGERCGVVVAVGMSPLRIRFAERRELLRLLSKFRSLANVGVRSFALLVDDMPLDFADSESARRFRTLGAAHAWLANEVWACLQRFGATELSLTPTEYCGTGHSRYLSDLGARLDPAIDVCWTGEDVCSATIGDDHLRTVGETLRRRPLLWDNYPVDDGGMQGELHLRPLVGRGPNVPGLVRGVLANGALEPEATAVVLHTLASWWRKPASYDPEAAWDAALSEVAGNVDDARALRIVGNVARHSALESAATGRLAIALKRFWQAWASDGRASWRRRQLDVVERELERVAAAGRRVAALRSLSLRRQLRPWTQKLERVIAVAREGVALLRMALLATGRDEWAAVHAARRALLRRLEALERIPVRVADDAIDGFGRHCVRAADRLVAGLDR